MRLEQPISNCILVFGRKIAGLVEKHEGAAQGMIPVTEEVAGVEVYVD